MKREKKISLLKIDKGGINTKLEVYPKIDKNKPNSFLAFTKNF